MKKTMDMAMIWRNATMVRGSMELNSDALDDVMHRSSMKMSICKTWHLKWPKYNALQLDGLALE